MVTNQLYKDRCIHVLTLPVLGQALMSLSLFELKPRFITSLKRLEAHFVQLVKSLSLDLSLRGQ